MIFTILYSVIANMHFIKFRSLFVISFVILQMKKVLRQSIVARNLVFSRQDNARSMSIESKQSDNNPPVPPVTR